MNPQKLRWSRAAIALPFPPALALIVTAILGTACSWPVFVGAEMLGILSGMATARLFGLDPMRFSKTFFLQQPWEKRYLWPDPFRLRRGAAAVVAAVLISLSAFFFPSGEFITAIFGGALGAWSYEGVRIFQNVYSAVPVAQPDVQADRP